LAEKAVFIDIAAFILEGTKAGPDNIFRNRILCYGL